MKEIIHNYLKEHHPNLATHLQISKDSLITIDNGYKYIKIYQESDTKIELHTYSYFEQYYITTIDIREPNSLRTLSTHINIELL